SKARSCWARDFISCKTPTKMYLTSPVKYSYTGPSLVKENKNISPFISKNTEWEHTVVNEKFHHTPSHVIGAGGNVIHCVNADGKYCVIAAESCFTSQIKVQPENPHLLFEVLLNNKKTGQGSTDKYSDE